MLTTHLVSRLEALSEADKLSGVPVLILQAIAQAESGGKGGGLNPEGYGGWFGLGTDEVPADVLRSTTDDAFDWQAQACARVFAGLLTKALGRPYAAEFHYQGGTSDGQAVFASMHVPVEIPWPPNPNVGNPPGTRAPTQHS
jgi:hypothetical protein